MPESFTLCITNLTLSEYVLVEIMQGNGPLNGVNINL